VPARVRPEMMAVPAVTENIIRFAVQIGISPGVLVGQLQYWKRLKPNQMNRLKRRFTWQEDSLIPETP
jgi:HTH-type transcriptional regulator / antitoxin HigA